jgi:hypothetical protein
LQTRFSYHFDYSLITRASTVRPCKNLSFQEKKIRSGDLRYGVSPGTPCQGSPVRRTAMASGRRHLPRPCLTRRRPGRLSQTRWRWAHILALPVRARGAEREGGKPRRRRGISSPPPRMQDRHRRTGVWSFWARQAGIRSTIGLSLVGPIG